MILQKKDKEETTWWINYVETTFHSKFIKACQGRYSFKYKIDIPGVSLQSLDKHVLVWENLTYKKQKLIVVHSKSNDKIYTPKSHTQADWLIDHIFNNCAKYKYTNIIEDITYEHYNDTFSWSLSNN